MLTKPTVLIVGAGASQPYGFPSGRELTSIIMNELSEHNRTQLGKELLAFGCKSHELASFATELKLSQHYSIDAFLNDRREFIEVGKLAIAAVLIPRENPTKLFESGDWYQYLSYRLWSQTSSERTAPLTILSYNYDRSLDHYLFTSCKHRYNLTNDATKDRLKLVEVIHLHGTLGNLPYQNPTQDGYEYQSILRHDHLEAAAQAIRIIHEDLNESPEYQIARSRLVEAKVVCFMGTSYHNKNIERLSPNLWVNNAERILGTIVGLPKAERPDIYAHFENKIGPHELTCHQLLQQVPILS